MNKYLLTGIIGLGLSISTQAQSFSWAKHFGGTGTESGTVVTTDANGNVYTIGQFTSEIDVDPGAPFVSFLTAGNSDIYLTKLDAGGNFLWAAQFGSTQGDFSVSMTVDKNDNVICSGVFQGTVDFDPGAGSYPMTSTSSGESFIVKLDSAGNFLWATQRTGYSGYDRNYGLDTDSAGNIYTAGLFIGTSDFDPGAGTNNLTSIGSYDIFIQKFDPDGNFIWVKQMGGSDADAVAYAMDVDMVGNIFITGYFTDTVDFNPSTALADTVKLIGDAFGDAFVARYDNAGNYVWAAALLGNSQGYGYGIAVDEALNVYSVGNFEGTIDGDPNPTNTINISAGSGNAGYVSKLDASGNYVWGGKLGGANSDATADGIQLDKYNNMYITGRFESGLTDFDPGAGTYDLNSFGSSDVYITKLTSSGNFVWAKQFGGTGYEVAGGLEVDEAGNIYGNGLFSTVSDFDPDAPVFNLTAVAGFEGFLFKLGTCYMANGITQIGSTLTLDVVSGPVQWVDCNNAYAPIAGATNQSFTPTINGSYAAVVSFQTCVDTSACYAVNTAGINETNNDLHIAVYPNPTTNYLTVQTDEVIEQIFIYNTLGALLQTETKNTFSVQHLASGMYVLQIKMASGTSTSRFIKE